MHLRFRPTDVSLSCVCRLGGGRAVWGLFHVSAGEEEELCVFFFTIDFFFPFCSPSSVCGKKIT